MTPRILFADTSFVVALVIETDTHHSRATELQADIRSDDWRLVTSRAVTIEVGNFLARGPARLEAVRLLGAMEAHSQTEIVPLTEDLYRRALHLYSERPDKNWGLTDCISFVIMRERGITEALTADEHFEQAGFRALLRQG